MASRGIETDWIFGKKAQFDIQFSLIEYDGGMSYVGEHILLVY